VIAFPLLAFSITGSPAAAGLAAAAMAAARTVTSLPGGALVDRWDRRTTMLLCQAGQGLATLSLAIAIWLELASLPHLLVVAAVLGAGDALFDPAEEASLPHVVRAEQLPAALGLNAGRGYLGQLGGSALGGLLFGLGRLFPFLASAVVHLASCVLLLLLRLPARQRSKAPVSELHREVWHGFRWAWRQPLIRTCALCAVSLNLLFHAIYLIVIVGAQQRSVPAGQIGLMAAMLGTGALLGVLAAGYLCRVVSPYLAIIAVFWTLSVLTPLMAFVQNVYLTGALLAAVAFLAPTANITITSRQLLLTPDELRGRLSSAMSLAGGLAATAGPAAGGVLLQSTGATQAVLLCGAGLVLTALAATTSPTLRDLPAVPERAPV
jgi:MFS family permease